MNNKNPKISYDRKSGVLSIEAKRGKSVDSDIQGNIVIDYDKKGDIIRFNLYGFDFDEFRDGVKAIEGFSQNSNLPVVVR